MLNFIPPLTKPIRISIIALPVCAILAYELFMLFPFHPAPLTRHGTIAQDETWSGVVQIDGMVQVPQQVTLTIQPDTIVKFQQNPNNAAIPKSGLEVTGKLIAIGTPEEQIQFTSAADAPRDGDWSGISMIGKSGSEIRYGIVEFGQLGIRLQESDARISHSIIRWHRHDGLSATSSSTPTIEYNRIYQNGGNGAIIKDLDRAMVRYNFFESSGGHGLHVDHSTAAVELNIFLRNQGSGIFLENESTVTARGNTLTENRKNQILCGDGQNHLAATTNAVVGDLPRVNCPKDAVVKNSYGRGIAAIGFDYPNVKKFDLGHTPNNPQISD
jgi:parallel beta-helix repeat protein